MQLVPNIRLCKWGTRWPSGPIPCPSGVWNGFLGTFGECSADCKNCGSIPSGLWCGFGTFCNWFGFLSSGVDIDSELIGPAGWCPNSHRWYEQLLSDLEDLSSLSELSLPILESNSDIFLQLRDLCRDFTNDVPFTIFKILLNFARCSRRWFPTKLDVNGMKKPTILVSYLTIVVNDDGTALPLGHRPNRLQLSEGSDPLACDHHDLTQTWSAIAAVSQAIFVLTRAFDVAHHWDHEMIAKLILYNLFSNSRFSLGTTLVAQADWVRDLPITWCRSRHKQYFLLADNSEYTPTAPTKLRVEKSLKIPLLSQVKYERFPEDCTEESTPAQQSLVSLSRAGDWDTAEPFCLCSNTAKLLATDPFGGGGNGGWATKTILDGPELDAASITCLGTGGGSFRAAVILTRCSVSIQPVEMRLQICWHWTAWSLRLCNHVPCRRCRSMLKQRPGGGPAGLGGWAGSRGRETSSVSSFSHWSSASPMKPFGQECTGTRWRTHQNCYLLRLSPTTRPMPVDCSPEKSPIEVIFALFSPRGRFFGS